MKKGKFFKFLGIAALGSVLLTGCGGEKNTQSNADKPEEAAELNVFIAAKPFRCDG